MKKLIIAGVLAATAALSGCATTGEGQGATDAFVSREMAKHGVVGNKASGESAPKSVTTVPVS